MIKDKISRGYNYYKQSEGIKRALLFLENSDMSAMSLGKHEIDGKNLYINIQEYTTKPQAEGKWEAHKKYIDIQYIIEGSENIGVTDVTKLSSSTEYDETKDIVFLEGTGEFVKMNKDDFLILPPEDAHMPCITADTPQQVKKAVVKIKI